MPWPAWRGRGLVLRLGLLGVCLLRLLRLGLLRPCLLCLGLLRLGLLRLGLLGACLLCLGLLEPCPGACLGLPRPPTAALEEARGATKRKAPRRTLRTPRWSCRLCLCGFAGRGGCSLGGLGPGI